MRPVIVGTAGHIDHGKTSLIEALTGIDCDRWAEEKRRGITIDLGFAHLTRGDLQLGFVDVPGHERFVHNALAGLGGIRIVLLVVAADEGVKPQTREHLAICSLLGIPSCIVALTKSDLADSEVLELARLEVEELLTQTPFKGSPIVAVSSTTGAGIDQLERLLEEIANRSDLPDARRPTRFPIDRGFHLKGLGVVATGTLVSGSIEAGQTLASLPAGEPARVRSVQVHGESRPRAVAGERTAIQVTGATLEQIRRGVQLVEDQSFDAATHLLGRWTLLADAPKPLRGWTAIRFHLLSSEVGGKIRPLTGPIEPGSEGHVEIRLTDPVVAVRGDRFVVRRPSPPLTLGGGVILDPFWRRRRAADVPSALANLDASREEAVRFWLEAAREEGFSAASLARRLGVRRSEAETSLQALASDQKALRMPAGRGHEELWISPSAYRTVVERAERALSGFFRRNRLSKGMPKATAVDRILPPGARKLSEGYFSWLEAQGVLSLQGDRIDLPGRGAPLTGEESDLASRIVEGFRTAGLHPPAPTELCQRLGAKSQIFDGLIGYLIDSGDLVRLPGGLLVSAQAIDLVENDLRSDAQIQFSVGDFKSRFQLTRKWAIPILEHLDSKGVTRRVGDLRQIVGPMS